MTTLDVILATLVAAILALPWTLKTAGFYNKVKKWYRLVLSGFVFALVPTTLTVFVSTWQALAFIASSPSYQWTILGLQAIAALIVIVGLLGVFKELITK